MSSAQWQVLHITDFHIRHPEGTDEVLRTGYYKELLNSLATQVCKPGLDCRPQCIIATGDFVDRGATGNFDHAKRIIEHLCKLLELGPENVAVCIGNHDFIRDVDKSGDPSGARASFAAFAEKFANGQPFDCTDRAILCRPTNNIWALMLDSTLGCNGDDKPGDLPVAQVDALMQLVDKVPRSDLLVIGTHYPVQEFPGSVGAYEEGSGWHARHLWSNATAFRERVYRQRADATTQTLWLCGDTHGPDHITMDGHHFVMTGRLGTPSSESTQIPRQVKVVTLPRSNSKPPNVGTFSYKVLGHKDQASYGDWQFNNAPVRVLYSEAPKANPNVESIAVKTAESMPAVEERLAIEGLDRQLEEEIVKAIRAQRLYRLGRFNTYEAEVSLSWVSVGPLLNQAGLFPSLVGCMSNWLQKTISNVDESLKETALVGIDCWGAVIASQLSVLMGCPNYCVAARARGRHHTESEQLSIAVLEQIKLARNVVLISDVVATGRSMEYIHEQIQTALNGKSVRWFGLSVLCDQLQKRSIPIDGFERFASACINLRMPLLPSGSLPDETILPASISLI